MQKFYKLNFTEIQIKAVQKIQKSWRKSIKRKKFKKALKQIKRKNFTAQELLTSQRTYCNHLKFIIKQVLQPSKKAIDDQQLHQILFCNITEIYMLHHIFLYKLQQLMKTYKTHTTEISKPLLQLFSTQNFCSSYTNYCFNYPKADKIMKLLTQNNSSFKEVLKKAGILNSSCLNLESYMIKPVQRLCKYKLMLVEYFKCMQNFHPDYEGIKKVIEIMEKLVESTNQQVEQFLMIQRYRELKYQYSTVFNKMVQNPQKPRKLVYEYDKGNIKLINMLRQQQTSLSSLLVFTDFVLLIPKPQSNNQTNIQQPYAIKILHVRKHENMKYFKNLLQIVDRTKYYTLSFQQEKQRDLLYQIIEVQRNNLIDKPVFFTVDVLGTERRESFFKFFTVYIIEINQNGKKTKIYPRFKTLLKVQEILMKKNVLFDLNVPPLQKETPHQTLKSKTIQKRKLHIRQFIQRLINDQKLMKIDQIRECLDYHEGKSQKKIKHLDQDQIHILLPNWQHTTVHLNSKTSKIKDLKAKISAQLQFIHNSQFQIFQIRNKNYSSRRLMYDDQNVIDIFNCQQSSFSSINPFSDKIDYMFSRHYYLSQQQQLSLYKIDFIRLQLELSVIKAQILQYSLQQELMITFMCLFAMYINLPLQDDKITNFMKEIIGKKNYKVPLAEFKVYYQEVQKIVSAEEDQLVTIPFLIIKILSNSRLYQCQQFQALIHQKCFKAIQKQIPSVDSQQIILGIKLTHMMILTPKQKHLIKSIQYKDIESMQMHPNGIIFKISQIESIFRIKTTQGYEISKLITIYKQKNVVKQNNNIGNIDVMVGEMQKMKMFGGEMKKY